MKFDDYRKLFEGQNIAEDVLKATFAAIDADETSTAAVSLKATAEQRLNAVTASIETLSGVKRTEGVEYSAYLQNAFGAAAGKHAKRVTELEAELEAAKKAAPAGAEDLQKLQNKIVELQTSLQNKDAEHNANLENFKRGTLVDTVLSGATLNKALKPEVVDPFLNTLRSKVQGLKLITGTADGKQVQYVADPDGLAPLVENGKPVTLNDYVRSQLSPILAATPQGGAGAGAGEPTPPPPPAPPVKLEGKTQMEAYEAKEREVAKLPLADRRKALLELVKSEAYNALPQ